MREAKLMETLWKKESQLQAKVNDFVHHRALERSSVNLQIGRVYSDREPVPASVRVLEASRRNLTLQPPAAMPLLQNLLDQGCRADVELAPKVSMLDQLRELRGWTPDAMKLYLAKNKLSSINNTPGVENYHRELRALDNLREERAPTPHHARHKSTAPLLLDDDQSALLLGVLHTSKASAAKKVQLLRDLPLSHSAKAEFIKSLHDVGPVERVELLRELPYSPTREYELLRELPLDPMRKLEFLRALPLSSEKKTDLMAELGLPLDEAYQTMGQMGLDQGRQAALVEEMRMHDFVEGEIARNFAALREAPIPVAEKLAILKELKITERERVELNRRLGFPVDPAEVRRDLGAY